MKAEREKSRMEMKDLQQQLSEMHDELDQAKTSEADRIQDEVLLKVKQVYSSKHVLTVCSDPILNALLLW